MYTDLRRMLWAAINHPDMVSLMQRALAQSVVSDTWMPDTFHLPISRGAQKAMDDYAHQWQERACKTQAIFPEYPMSRSYIYALLRTTLVTTALYLAQRTSRRLTRREVTVAAQQIEQFVAREPLGFTALARVFNLVWVHEDFNALWYYRRMAREAFLSGLSHRPWAKDLLEDQLRVYRTAGLVQEIFTGLGDMLELTAHGATMYRRLREVLEQAGEFLWRSEQQRWVLFHQLDFDRVFAQLFPDAATRTEHFLSRLPLTKGLRILEVGAGTGRIIFDHGLFRRVLPGGTVVALDSSPRMLARLGQKRRACRARHVRIIHGYGESLPFADAQFDVTMAVMALHFMDAPQVLAEMIRVTRPGGTVAVMSPHPGFDIRQIPMMALWMRPIYDLADRFQLPSTERNGLRPGELRQWFFEHPRLMSPHYERVPMLATVQPHREAFAFYVQGAAIFQNVLARLPYAERQNFLKRLMEQGDMIASQTSDSEKQYTYYPEMAWGCVK